MLDLSVVIPTFDNAGMLDRLLASLARQTGTADVRWEVVVVDNNCHDDTAAVVARHAAGGTIPRLRRVEEPVQGARAARCRGFRETSAPLLACVDDDTVLDPAWIAEAVRFMAAHPRAGAVGGRIALAWAAPPPAVCERYGYALARQDYGDETTRLPATGVTWLMGAGVVIRRAALEASGWVEAGYLPGRIAGRDTAGEDTELVLRIRRAGWELWYDPAMRQEHHIPASRASVDYLCRMLRGNCRTDVVFDAMAREEWPGLGWRARYLAREVRAFVRGATRAAAKRALGRAGAEDRVRAAERAGRLRGALDLVRDGRGPARVGA